MLPSLQVENAGFLLEGKNELGSDAPERMKVLPYTYCGPGKGSSSLPTPSSNISRIRIAVKPLLSSLSPHYNKHVCIFITVVSSPIRVLQWSVIQHLHKESCYHSWEASIWRDVWVLNSDFYINSTGNTIQPSLSEYIWSPECLSAKADKLSVHEITLSISTPLSVECLHEMVTLVETTVTSTSHKQ